MAALMYDAVTAMGAPRAPARRCCRPATGSTCSSRSPTITAISSSFRSTIRRSFMSASTATCCAFTLPRRPNGEVDSDFDLDNAPALAFAARATSSFPGRLSAGADPGDGRAGRARRRVAAPRRLPGAQFRALCTADVDPTTASFIDGAVLNNRPFQEAISAIRGRPAYRQVDRRLVYIEPHPAPAGSPAHHGMPGFFATLKGALSDIPSSQPVTDELSWVDRFQRPGAAAARDHRQRAAACQPAGRQGHHRGLRPADRGGRAARLARAGQFPGRARCRLCLPGLCAAQARLGARLRRPI